MRQMDPPADVTSGKAAEPAVRRDRYQQCSRLTEPKTRQNPRIPSIQVCLRVCPTPNALKITVSTVRFCPSPPAKSKATASPDSQMHNPNAQPRHVTPLRDDTPIPNPREQQTPNEPE